jgi:hypothetical protein
MAFKMKYKNLEEVVDQLRKAVKAHGKQAKIIEEHIDDMESPMKDRTRGISEHNTAHAKHDRGQGPDPHAKEKTPLEKRGSWEYGGKTYYGDYIREDSKYTYYRTHNNKIKKKPKRK